MAPGWRSVKVICLAISHAPGSETLARHPGVHDGRGPMERAVIDPMAMNDVPEGHCRCCSRRDQTYRLVRWLGPIYTIYKIMSDHWPW